MDTVNELFKAYEKRSEKDVEEKGAYEAVEEYDNQIVQKKQIFDAYLLGGISYFITYGDEYHNNKAIYYFMKAYIRACEISLKTDYMETRFKAIALYWMGRYSEQNKEYAIAVTFYSQVIEFEPTFIRAYGDRSECYEMLDMIEERDADIDKWRELKEAQDEQA